MKYYHNLSDKKNMNLLSIGKALSFFFLFFSIFIFYLWAASSKYGQAFVFKLSPEAQGYHHFMADAFLHGQLNLRTEPPKELLALSDPYDPALNEKFRLHDASLYNGKYFLYFTPAIALLFIAPFKIIFGYFLSESLLTALLCFLGFFFSFLALRKLLKFGSVEVSAPTLLTSALTLATATAVPFLLRRPAVYELCIAAAYAFIMIGTYLLLCAVEAKRNRSVILYNVFAGTLLGLCILSRPTQLFGCGLLVLAFPAARHLLHREKTRLLTIHTTYLIAPLIIIGSAMCWYNYARFNSIFEFGLFYQLAGIYMHHTELVSIKYIFFGVFNYLFQPTHYEFRFPFIHAAPIQLLETHIPYTIEPVIGLAQLPIYWLVLMPLFCIRYLWKSSPLLLSLSVFILASGVSTLISVSSMAYITMRYIVDFSPMILLATISLFLMCRNLVFKSTPSGLIVSRLMFYTPALFSIIASLLLGMTGY